MHDVVNVRALHDDAVDEMIERCQPCFSAESGVGCPIQGMDADKLEVADKSDLLFIKGLGNQVRRGFSVENSEYIAFHPYQCLPKYEIKYELS